VDGSEKEEIISRVLNGSYSFTFPSVWAEIPSIKLYFLNSHGENMAVISIYGNDGISRRRSDENDKTIRLVQTNGTVLPSDAKSNAKHFWTFRRRLRR
jgi:hypothetical protein